MVYCVCCLGVLSLRSKGVEQAGKPFIAPGGAIVPLAATGLVGWLLSSLTREELLATLVPIAISGIAYAVQARNRKAAKLADGSLAQ